MPFKRHRKFPTSLFFSELFTRLTDYLFRPTLISVKTTIGLGSIKQGTEKTHGSPLGDEDLANVKKKFGLNPDEKFAISEDVAQTYSAMEKVGQEKEEAWNKLFDQYRTL